MDSSLLIKKCNEFLDDLLKFREEISLKFSKNTNLDNATYNELIETLNKNLEVLEELKEKMELQGFDTPYVGVGKLKGCDEGDLYEIKSYSSYLRRIVDEKKGVLERVKYAIIAHKIALGHLQDPAGNKRLIYFLPYDGSNKELLSNMSPLCIKTYKKLLNVLESEGKGILSSITMTLIIMNNGKKTFKRVKIEDEDYEGYIKKNYGDALITSLKKNYSKNKLLTDSHVKKTLSLAYLMAYWEEVEYEIEKKLKNELSEHQRSLIDKYKNTIMDFEEGEVEGGIIDIRIMEELKVKRIKMNEKLEKLGLYVEGRPIPELEKSLNIEREVSEKLSFDIIIKYISQDIFEYYLYNTPDERARSNMFPTILINPSRVNLKWMRIEGINPLDVLDIKFLFERELPKYNITLKNIGGAALYLVHDWDVVKRYNYTKKEVEEILSSIAPIDEIKSILKKNNIDLKKLEEYNSIKKERTKKFLGALGKL
ncbi:DUF530 family protein [Methanothermococcus sp. SCGC AD-155-C09]|nr:DUF530 family protein [Methanothermococcus sp. SCGC AD-155-C09]